jgi:hypothetical protein
MWISNRGLNEWRNEWTLQSSFACKFALGYNRLFRLVDTLYETLSGFFICLDNGLVGQRL